MFPTVPRVDIPVLSIDEMIEVDRIVVDDLGIDLARMMENAGRALAVVTREMARSRCVRSVDVLTGTGGNGGGAAVAARRLAGWGFDVSVYPTRPIESIDGVTAEQLAILAGMGVPVRPDEVPRRRAADTIVLDGLVGYRLSGAPRGRARELIECADDSGSPVVSLDVPSGVDPTTGRTPGVAISATATVTLALPKSGLFEAGRRLVGDLYLADIGVPASVYRDAFGIEIGGVFDRGDVVRLD